jgi:hypothetical protein
MVAIRKFAKLKGLEVVKKFSDEGKIHTGIRAA